jgi:hypothetical protein
MFEHITLDLETLPCQDAAMTDALRADADDRLQADLDAVRAPGNYKDEAKIAEYVQTARTSLLREHEARVQADWLKTGLDGGLGHICCIGYAIGDGQPQSIIARHDTPGDEAAALREFFGVLSALGSGARLTWVGHNLVGFDLPFLWKRAIVHGIRPSFHLPRDPKPWSEQVYDTMLQWAGARGTISMDRLCRVLGIPGKGGMDGSQVWPLAQEGRYAEIASYCEQDVSRTRLIHRRMTFTQDALKVAA